MSRSQNPDLPVNDEVAPAQIGAIGAWGAHPGKRFAYLKASKEPTLIVIGTHDVSRYPINSLSLVRYIRVVFTVL